MDPFYLNLAKHEFSWKKWLSQFQDIPVIYHHAKYQERNSWKRMLRHFLKILLHKQNLQTKKEVKKSLKNSKFQARSFKYKYPLQLSLSLPQGFWLGGLGFQFLCHLIFLRKFGDRNKFVYMIQVASTNIQSKMKINGLLSESFTIFLRDFSFLTKIELILELS